MWEYTGAPLVVIFSSSRSRFDLSADGARLAGGSVGLRHRGEVHLIGEARCVGVDEARAHLLVGEVRLVHQLHFLAVLFVVIIPARLLTVLGGDDLILPLPFGSRRIRGLHVLVKAGLWRS